MRRYKLLIFNVLFLFVNFGFGQEVSIKLGKNTIAQNELFTITVVINNENLRNYSPFPEINGFVKRGISSSSSTSIVNGQTSFSQSIVQNYSPKAQGKYTLPPFSMAINGTKINSNGTTINVEPPKQVKQQYDPFSMDPFEDFFGRPNTPQEFIDVKDDAFFSLETDKKSVYVGEGLNLSLAFYVAETNRAEMQFISLPEQLGEILKKVKPANCWEENFNINEVIPESIKIGNKKYAKYKLYEGLFYPLNLEPVTFISVGLKMVKYKISKQRGFFGHDKQQDFKTFFTKPLIVKVKNLPTHPLKDKVSVGQFRLKEEISRTKIITGEAFNYSFIIEGEGNIASINKPELENSKEFDIFDPNIRQNISRVNGRVKGNKIFNYFIVPNEPGNFQFSNFYKWIYFDPIRAKYDTLIPKSIVTITGESKKNIAISSNSSDDFYQLLSKQSNRLIDLDTEDNYKRIANIMLLAMIVLTGIFIVRRKQT